MFIERPPLVYRLLYRGAVWRAARRYRAGRPVVYLTFDDGPTPEATPGVLEILGRYGIHATFFMVADNARRYPTLLDNVHAAGHIVGNHTTHHLRGLFTTHDRYIADINEAETILGHSEMFRPPHGFMRPKQYRTLKQRFRIVMQDVVSRDYSRSITPEIVVRNVLTNVRPGSVICLHDSEKAAHNVLGALENIIIGLDHDGYTFDTLRNDD